MAIADLDELLLGCRSDAAKMYMGEAIASYHGGAYRACVVTTWIAVLFDLLDKLRELAMTGDRKAKQKIDEFDAIRAKGEAAYREGLQFERELLAFSATEFELLTPVELADLDRLRDDRNRCAHPSMQATDIPYQPPAELARLHVRNAVELLLAREPVQGRAAFKRLEGEFESPYFPEDVEGARAQLAAGPFRRARRPLVRDVLIAVSMSLLKEDVSAKQRRQRVAALRAAMEMHRRVAEEVVSRDLPTRITAIATDDWWRVVQFVSDVEGSWELLGTDVQARVRRVIEEIERQRPSRVGIFDIQKLSPSEQVNERLASKKHEAGFKFAIEAAFRSKELRRHVLARLDDLDSAHLSELVVQTVDVPGRESLMPEIVERFCRAGNWDTARTLSPAITTFASMLSLEQTRSVLRAFVDNGEVNMAGGVPDKVMPVVFANTAAHGDALRAEWLNVYQRLLGSYWAGAMAEELREAIRRRYPEVDAAT